VCLFDEGCSSCILKTCQPVVRENQEQFDPVIASSPHRDFPASTGRKIILVGKLRAARSRYQAASAHRRKQSQRRRQNSSLHGFATAPGALSRILRARETAKNQASSMSNQVLAHNFSGAHPLRHRQQCILTHDAVAHFQIQMTVSARMAIRIRLCSSGSSKACRTLSRYCSKIRPTATNRPPCWLAWPHQTQARKVWQGL